ANASAFAWASDAVAVLRDQGSHAAGAPPDGSGGEAEQPAELLSEQPAELFRLAFPSRAQAPTSVPPQAPRGTAAAGDGPSSADDAEAGDGKLRRRRLRRPRLRRPRLRRPRYEGPGLSRPRLTRPHLPLPLALAFGFVAVAAVAIALVALGVFGETGGGAPGP